MSEHFDYLDYLESKVEIDFRSINRSVFKTFKKLIESTKSPIILDIGTGTGLMIRKILALKLKGAVKIYGIDYNTETQEKAFEMIKLDLESKKYTVKTLNNTHIAENDNRKLKITILNADFLNEEIFRKLKKIGFHCITANSFMDLVPLNKAVKKVFMLLRENGIFYSSINYDGVTALLPKCQDNGFEQVLLERYNQSMDIRKVDGLLTGGSRTGTKIFNVVQDEGFKIVNYGCSDWQIFPEGGEYRKYEPAFLKSILSLIYEEGNKDKLFDDDKLRSWYRLRIGGVEDQSLVLITHQTDIVAIKRVKEKIMRHDN